MSDITLDASAKVAEAAPRTPPVSQIGLLGWNDDRHGTGSA